MRPGVEPGNWRARATVQSGFDGEPEACHTTDAYAPTEPEAIGLAVKTTVQRIEIDRKVG